VNEFGVDFFEGIRTGEIKPAEASAVAGGGSGGGVNIGLINSRQERNEWMATEGAKIAYDYAERRRRR
jgi:glucokinase